MGGPLRNCCSQIILIHLDETRATTPAEPSSPLCILPGPLSLAQAQTRRTSTDCTRPRAVTPSPKKRNFQSCCPLSWSPTGQSSSHSTPVASGRRPPRSLFPKQLRVTFCLRGKCSMHHKCPRLREMGTSLPDKTFTNEDTGSFAHSRATHVENGLVDRAVSTHTKGHS